MDTPRIRSKNCVNCDHYFSCKDSQKSILFRCDRYKKTARGEKNEIAFFSENAGVDLVPESQRFDYMPVVSEADKAGQDEAYNMLDVLTQEKRLVSPDVRLPERDFSEAPNFYTWCVSDKYLNMKPFVEQALMGTELLTEWCPRCSDIDWMKNRHKVGDSLHKFDRRVALFEYGKCPHCGLTRDKAIRKGKLNPYYELAACCGQRCVSYGTMVLTEDGLMEIGEYASGKPDDFSDFQISVHNGSRMETTSNYFITPEKENLLLLRLNDGSELAATRDHPVKTVRDLKKISDITVDDWVPVVVGQGVYANKQVVANFSLLDKGEQEWLATNIGHTPIAEGECLKEAHAFRAGSWTGSGHGVALSILSRVTGEDLSTFDARSSIPKFVRQGSRSMQASYLRGLCDISASLVGCQFVGISVSFHRLFLHVSAMLKNFGIKHKTVRNPDTACWTLLMTGEDISSFSNIIGFAQSEKQKRAQDMARFSANSNTPLFYEILPPHIQDRAEAFSSELPSPYTLPSPVTKRSLRKMLDCADRQILSEEMLCEHSILRSYLDRHIYFAKVRSVTEKSVPELAYDFTLPETHLFVSNGIISHNSGKSAFFGMIGTYHAHRVIKMERPNEVYRLLKSNVLQGTFVALTFAQAKDTLWEPFYGNILESPWFQEYHSMLELYGSRYNEELFKLKDTFVYYKHRRLYFYPAGPDLRILRGKTRILAGIDELGLFPNDASAMKNIKMNAHEVYTSLENSLATVRAAASKCWEAGFYNVPQALFINISSPFSVRDKIMELVRKSQSSPVILGWHKSTWEMNPTMPLDSLYLQQKFRSDPIAAMRDFGAKPPLTNNGFIQNRDYVMGAFSGKPNQLRLRYEYLTSSDRKSKELYAAIEFIKESGKPSVIALDGGHTNNSFAFAVGHLGKNDYPVFSLVGEIIPEPGIPINYSHAYTDFLLPIIAARNVVIARADRWNSLKILSDMERDTGLQKSIYSLKYDDMLLFKSYLADGQILIPTPLKTIDEILAYDQGEYPRCFRDDPTGHLILQMLTVQDTGSQVIKGDGLTDDILRAMMLGFITLIDEDIKEELRGPDKTVAVADGAQSRMYVKPYSSGGGGSMSGGGANGLGMLRSRT